MHTAVTHTPFHQVTSKAGSEPEPNLDLDLCVSATEEPAPEPETPDQSSTKSLLDQKKELLPLGGGRQGELVQNYKNFDMARDSNNKLTFNYAELLSISIST